VKEVKHPPSLSPSGLAIAGWSAFLLDVRVADWLHAHRNSALTLLFLALTHLHSPVAVAAASSRMSSSAPRPR
jgi:hypothetical protein